LNNLLGILIFVLLVIGYFIREFLGHLGDSKGPGWRDLLQGGFGLLWMIMIGVLSIIWMLKNRNKKH